MNDQSFFDLAMKIIARQANDAERANLDALLAHDPELRAKFAQLETDARVAKDALPLIAACTASTGEFPAYARERLQTKVRQTLGRPESAAKEPYRSLAAAPPRRFMSSAPEDSDTLQGGKMPPKLSDRSLVWGLRLVVGLPLAVVLLVALLIFRKPHAPVIPSNYEVKALTLPGATGGVSLDYVAYDPATGRLWVPASNTGRVDVIDDATDAVSQVTGFQTGEVELRGRKVTLGPTAVSIGDGVAYIGDRGDSSLCSIDTHSLERGECLQVAPPSAGRAAAPDGVVYVAATREVWITTGAPPIGISSADKSLQVFDASDPRHLKLKIKIPLDGSAEGYAVDNQRGLFYTNVEETGDTVAIDVGTHKVVSKWNAGSKSLEGLALDNARGFLFVACGDHVVSLDVNHDGKIADSIATGPGLDNIDYSAEKKLLYAAASQAATLTVAEVDDHGKFQLKATVPTVKGARGVVAAQGETAYLIDPAQGRILKITHK